MSPLCLTKLHTRSGHPRLFACTMATILLAAFSAGIFAWDVGLSFERLIPVMSGIELFVNQSGPGVGLALIPVNIDLSSSTLTLNWWTTGCGRLLRDRRLIPGSEKAKSALELSELGCGLSQTSYSVWVDSAEQYSRNASDELILQRDNHQIRFAPMETFNTLHSFTWISDDQTLASRRQHSASAWYPYDVYTISTIIEAFDNIQSGPSSLPIYFLHLYGGHTGYKTRIDSVEAVANLHDDRAVYVTFSIRRCFGVKLFAITLFLTSYLLSCIMVYIAVCAHCDRSVPDTALFLPLANILLIPQLRAAMPDAPDFGVFMDLFGYYVNMVAVCMATLLTFSHNHRSSREEV
ncbi:hypothetical protein BD310DRAFT_939477 [Dichomitus squalens]|uniref:Uncharacterized protein n=1 Tax=Dichomitus squalens TaxID=114155 RepID=A0A4Q9PH69_9APHY|nr:hypothetical protein BD310DRAFT_939477 [Dichomitus squalens]